MNRKEINKTFMMILKRKNPLVAMFFTNYTFVIGVRPSVIFPFSTRRSTSDVRISRLTSRDVRFKVDPPRFKVDPAKRVKYIPTLKRGRDIIKGYKLFDCGCSYQPPILSSNYYR